MNHETHQAVLLQNQVRLPLPQFNRIVAQYMEEAIVLRGGHGQFEDLPNEVRHNGAAAAPLRVQMGYVWNRHVIGKIQSIVPVDIPVQTGRAKSPSSITRSVRVNMRHAL